MQKQILIPIDYSDVSKEVVQIADEWGQREHANLFFLHVSQGGDQVEKVYVSDTPELNIESFGPLAKAEHERLKEFIGEQNVKSDFRTLYSTGKPYVQILEAEKTIGADLIIMAAHSHTRLGRILLGSNTDFVSHHSRCPLYVHKEATEVFNNTILVPLDYSEVNKPVVKAADEWAQRTGAELAFLHVAGEKGKDDVDHAVNADTYVTQFVESVGVKSYYHSIGLGSGKSYTEILNTRKRLGAKMIMIAAHSHTMKERWMKGSNTDYLLHNAGCPMYVYKENR